MKDYLEKPTEELQNKANVLVSNMVLEPEKFFDFTKNGQPQESPQKSDEEIKIQILEKEISVLLLKTELKKKELRLMHRKQETEINDDDDQITETKSVKSDKQSEILSSDRQFEISDVLKMEVENEEIEILDIGSVDLLSHFTKVKCDSLT